MLEIHKMLTLSTAHITPETANQLDEYLGYFAEEDPNHRPAEEPEQQFEGLAVYPKAEYGWFIYIGHADGAEGLPADLAYLIGFTQQQGCLWLCLDRDGDVVDDLISYEW